MQKRGEVKSLDDLRYKLLRGGGLKKEFKKIQFFIQGYYIEEGDQKEKKEKYGGSLNHQISLQRLFEIQKKTVGEV